MDPPAGSRRSLRYIPEVESLRGIAILLVLIHHTDGMLTPNLGNGIEVSPLRAFAAGGQSGVSLFFVLSAFCLSAPFMRPNAEGGGFSLRRFYARRALRILPLYWSSLVVGALLWSGSVAGLVTALPWAGFLQSLPGFATPMPPFTNVLWSLATEAQFYLLLPLLGFAASSSIVRYLATTALVAYVAWFVWLLFGGSELSSIGAQFALGHSVFGRGPIFLIGILVAWLYTRHGDTLKRGAVRIPAMARGGSDLVLVGLLLTLSCLLRWQVALGYWNAESRPLFAWHVAEGLLWGGVLLALLVLPLHCKKVFSNRALEAAGLWSYSIYLLHLPLIVWSFTWLRHCGGPQTYLEWDAHSAIAAAAIWAVCIALSSQTYRWIERPFLVRKAKLEE